MFLLMLPAWMLCVALIEGIEHSLALFFEGIGYSLVLLLRIFETLLCSFVEFWILYGSLAEGIA